MLYEVITAEGQAQQGKSACLLDQVIAPERIPLQRGLYRAVVGDRREQQYHGADQSGEHRGGCQESGRPDRFDMNRAQQLLQQWPAGTSYNFV